MVRFYRVHSSVTTPENYHRVLGNIGLREASTFEGFCYQHDNTIFCKIDAPSFDATPDNIFLNSYRAVSMRVRSALNSHQTHQRYEEKMIAEDYPQVDKNKLKILQQIGKIVCSKDLPVLEAKYHEYYLKNRSDDLEYCIIPLSKRPWFLCNDVETLLYDPALEQIAVNQDGPLEEIACTVQICGDGGVLVFSHLNVNRNGLFKNFVEKIREMTSEEAENKLLLFIFTHFFNVLISPVQIGETQKCLLEELFSFNTDYQPGRAKIYQSVMLPFPQLGVEKFKYKLLSQELEESEFKSKK